MKNILFLFFYWLSFSCISCQSLPQSAKPLKQNINNNNTTNLTKYLSAKTWNELFPNRHGIHLNTALNSDSDFYSFKTFVQAAKLFPAFIAEGNDTIQKRELAAFLANIAQETSGGWEQAPGGYFKWGLYFLKEQPATSSSLNIYNDTSKKDYPGVVGKYYYGRGPKQLTWNYNYGQFSEAWFGDKNVLLNDPDLIAKDPLLSFSSAIWFWMTPQFPKPSCHAIMTGKWIPTQDDTDKGRLPGFGATVNVINGGVECGTGKDLEKTTYRYEYYKYFCNYFKVSFGNNVECTNQIPFGR